ncbi:hypothetical protein Tco_1309655 [Tanacetum coccineum]
MTEVYYPRNEIQKMETELWNLTMKGNDLTLPIHPKLFSKGVLRIRGVWKITKEDNRGSVNRAFKRQNTSGPNVTRAYTAGNNERKGVETVRRLDIRLGIVGLLLLQTLRVAPNRGNQTRNKNGNKTGNQTGGNETTARAYAIGGGGTNPEFQKPCFTFLTSSLVEWYGEIPCVISFVSEKVVRIPYGNEVLIIRGDNYDSGSKLNIISCTKTQKYIEKGCQVYLAQVTSKKAEDKSEERRLEDVPIIREFLEVFPEDLPGLPPLDKLNSIDLAWCCTL